MKPTINVTKIEQSMRSTGRESLVHYAGAAHRDKVAWWMCAEYEADPSASEWMLKSRALKKAHGWDVTPAELIAASPEGATLR